MKKYCEECGSGIKEGIKFCSSCGAKVFTEEVAVKEEVIEKERFVVGTNKELSEAEKGRQIFFKWMTNSLKAIGILILITIVFSLLGSFFSSDKKEVETPPSTVEAKEESLEDLPAISMEEPVVEEVIEEHPSSEYLLPESNSREYTVDELSILSMEDLRIARNEIYARHGVSFISADLVEYFNSTSWYESIGINSADFDEGLLNSFELKNIDTITKLEEGESSTNVSNFIGKSGDYVNGSDETCAQMSLLVAPESETVNIYFTPYDYMEFGYSPEIGVGHMTSDNTATVEFYDGIIVVEVTWVSPDEFNIDFADGSEIFELWMLDDNIWDQTYFHTDLLANAG